MARTQGLSLTVRTLPLTELLSHPVISPTILHLKPTRLHTSPGSSNSCTNFLWGNPQISYILLRRTYRLNYLSAVLFFMLGAICNRWKIVARTQGLSLTVRTLPLSYWVTRSYHQQFSTWNLPRLHKHELIQYNIFIEKHQISFIQPKLSIVL